MRVATALVILLAGAAAASAAIVPQRGIAGIRLTMTRAQVRAERSGNKRVPGDGRMYYINFTGTDAEGGKCTGQVKVGVPHDQGNGNTIVEGGPIYKSTGQ